MTSSLLNQFRGVLSGMAITDWSTQQPDNCRPATRSACPITIALVSMPELLLLYQHPAKAEALLQHLQAVEPTMAKNLDSLLDGQRSFGLEHTGAARPESRTKASLPTI
ncbi:MAG: hypothetical protein HC886_15725 [Leptolyngbyaceae cyanobacterium SM1_1_3]|nr:hypothetical protein [Leptolyngbyaceae cyanobacterium SM1_1_3]